MKRNDESKKYNSCPFRSFRIFERHNSHAVNLSDSHHSKKPDFERPNAPRWADWLRASSHVARGEVFGLPSGALFFSSSAPLWPRFSPV